MISRTVIATIFSALGTFIALTATDLGAVAITLIGWAVAVTIGFLLTLREVEYLRAGVIRAEALAEPQAPASTAMTVAEALARPSEQRIGDAEREAVLQRLKDRYATGHLNDEELDRRQRFVLQAVISGDLAYALRDLP